MRAHTPLALALRAFAAAGALALLTGPLAASADQQDGRYDLPDHSLAAGDEIGTKLFDRRSHVVLKPRHEEKLAPRDERKRHEIPAWPAKWAPPEEAE